MNAIGRATLTILLLAATTLSRGETSATRTSTSAEASPRRLDVLRSEWREPPASSGVRCWWWWLNGNVTKEAITADLEAMAARGFSGGVIVDADGSGQKKNDRAPAGPMYGSDAWRELFLHALNEADRLNLTLGLSIQSGWNLGGPYVTPEHAAKLVTTSETTVEGPGTIAIDLPTPPTRDGYYRDIRVLAWPKRASLPKRRPISNLAVKIASREGGSSAPDCRYLLEDHPGAANEHDAPLEDVIDLTPNVDSEGTLRWDIPAGTWTVLRVGYTMSPAHVSTSSGDWQGRVIDYLSVEAFDSYWDRSVLPLLDAAGPLVGTVLTHLETDSWECGGMNWSPRFADEFRAFNGYDIAPYLPVLAGKIIESREVSNAFLADFRKTIAHCISENHYRVFAERAASRGMGVHPECSGPHTGPLDGITNYSHSDMTMSEFWAPSPHRPDPPDRFYVKQASSAAHIYGKRLVGAEAFTTIGPHWNDSLWRSMKPSMDYAFGEGLNTIFFHTFTCSPESMGLPGQEYFAGTHVNPRVTWWGESQPFMDYINRVQHLTQSGRFVADILCYTGDHVPNIPSYKGSDPPGALPGFDFDYTNEDVLLKLEVVGGRVVTPGETSYRVLVLPDHGVLSLAALEQVERLLSAGATVLGAKPTRLVSLVGGEPTQDRFARLADDLWGESPVARGSRSIGEGRLSWGRSSRDFLIEDGVRPDFEAHGPAGAEGFEYIHYRVGDADVYFVANQTASARNAELSFRVSGRQPQFWEPASGTIRDATRFALLDESTSLPMRFEPHGSLFVVFDERANTGMNGSPNSMTWRERLAVEGPWEVSFDPRWGGPAEPVIFSRLTSWIDHPNPAIRDYSGRAIYRTTFDAGDSMTGRPVAIELGRVEDVGVARVRLNGRDLGVTWLPPFRVDLSDAIQPGLNELEVVVVNSWHNRVMADEELPQNQRLTNTNIRVVRNGKFKWKPEDSGLLGPVRLVTPDAPVEKHTRTTAVAADAG